jgi:hypothetical protein
MSHPDAERLPGITAQLLAWLLTAALATLISLW